MLLGLFALETNYDTFINYNNSIYIMGKQKKHILKVRENKNSKQKVVTIPQEAKEIECGDYVEVKKHE